MTIRISNAPCSWGVEFAGDPRNPSWESVLDQCSTAGYKGIELGPVGFMPEDSTALGDALAARDLSLVGGVVFQPFHDAQKWQEVQNFGLRTCESLRAHGAEHIVFIDSISPLRAPTAGRPNEAVQMSCEEWQGFIGRIGLLAKIATEEYGLTASIHPHAGGFVDFLPEVERLLSETDPNTLKLCVDTGHSQYAGFNPVKLMRRYANRLSYVHFKDIDERVKQNVISNRVDFYEACAQGIFCRLGEGETNFSAIHRLLLDIDYSGWCTVEQDCDPLGNTSPIDNAIANRNYLQSLGF